MNTALICSVLFAVAGWFLNNLYQTIVKRIDGKVDKSCHDQCTKDKEHMTNLLLDEIRGLRADFKDKSTIVIDAVKSRKRK